MFLLGLVGFATNPALNTRAFGLVDGATTLVAAGNVVAFNVGITVGPWLGGLAIGAGSGYASTAWIGAGLGVLAMGAVALGQVRRRAPAVEAERVPAEA
ncbi:hypothetical protein [Actinomadura sp. CNU-125]|uniref:hypothetical protein n=1 Tax=Actinomadura sp. CNU-125 TaxID=1904961 RepID=UPI000AD6F9E7|nr:hypothetical protein [Actinomadura sp. CNU-125]